MFACAQNLFNVPLFKLKYFSSPPPTPLKTLTFFRKLVVSKVAKYAKRSVLIVNLLNLWLQLGFV